MTKRIIAFLISILIVSSMTVYAAEGNNTRNFQNYKPVTKQQYILNLDNNPNYVLIYSKLGIGYYLDIQSIVVKENDSVMRWWSQAICSVNMETKQVGEYKIQSYSYDRTNGNTNMYNYSTKSWETIETYDPRESVQVESRGFSIGYIYAFQGGYPVN